MSSNSRIFGISVQVTENGVPRVIDLKRLDSHTQKLLINLYENSRTYPSHVNNVQALEDSLRMYVTSFFNWLEQTENAPCKTPETIGDTFARTMGFIPENYPNCYKAFQVLASERPNTFSFKKLASKNIPIADIKREFNLWYSTDHKLAGLKNVKPQDFMRFYITLLKRI